MNRCSKSTLKKCRWPSITRQRGVGDAVANFLGSRDRGHRIVPRRNDPRRRGNPVLRVTIGQIRHCAVTLANNFPGADKWIERIRMLLIEIGFEGASLSGQVDNAL